MLALLMLACVARRPSDLDPSLSAAELRRQSIVSLEGLLASDMLSEQQRPDAMLRLAELYRDEARARFLEEHERAFAGEPR